MKNLSKKVISLVLICVLIVGVSAPKKAYAVAIADDAVVIVCCLLAAAGITFATSDGVTDAVSDFLEQSGGKFDSLLSQLASNRVLRGGMEGFLIPMELASQVRGLLQGLYDYFTVGDDRTGSVERPSGKNVFYTSASSGGALYTFATPEEFFTYEFAFHMNPKYVAEDRCLPIYYCHIEKTGDINYAVVCDNYTRPDGINEFTSGNIGSTNKMELHFANDTTSKKGLGLKLYPRPIGDGYKYESREVSLFSWLLDKNYFPTNLRNTAVAYITDNLGNVIINDKYVSSVSVPEIGTTSLPYGLTFPEELTYEDVLDRFEERLAAAAGDLAIVYPETGVVDNTLTYQEAQEQVLVNVNELGEVTDTTTETNTWLQKLLVSVKAIPATLIGLLEALLIKLFCPTDTVLQGGFDGIMAAFKEKTDYQTYMDLLSRFQGLSEPDLDDITINWYGKTYTVITWDFFRRTKAVYSRYLRGFLYLFLLLFNFNNVYKLIRNSSFFDGSGMNQRNQSRKGD